MYELKKYYYIVCSDSASNTHTHTHCEKIRTRGLKMTHLNLKSTRFSGHNSTKPSSYWVSKSPSSLGTHTSV